MPVPAIVLFLVLAAVAGWNLVSSVIDEDDEPTGRCPHCGRRGDGGDR